MVAPAVLTDRGRFSLTGRPRQGHLRLDLCEFGGAVWIAAAGLPLLALLAKATDGVRCSGPTRAGSQAADLR